VNVAEKKLLQETHDSIIQLKAQFETIIIGNGVKGLAKTVRENSDFIAKIKDLPQIIKEHDIKIGSNRERFNKAYYKIIGGGIVIVAVMELVAKLIFKL